MPYSSMFSLQGQWDPELHLVLLNVNGLGQEFLVCVHAAVFLLGGNFH